MLLLAGGDRDPQIIRLLKQAAKQGIQVDALLTGQSGTPNVCWDIKKHALTEDKQVLQPKAAFIRQDVFTYLQTNKSHDQAIAREWFVTLAGWLLASPAVQVFNRDFLERGPVNKPYILHLATQHGLTITETLITNDGLLLEEMAPSKKWIQKPVSGGAHCEELKQENRQGVLSYPQIIQNKLQAPELRVFRIGERWFAFQIMTDALDYRTSTNTRIRLIPVPEELREKMRALCDSIGLNFAAADFKTDAKTGCLNFLEINTNPMFAGFDQYANGQLCQAMLDWLLPNSVKSGEAKQPVPNTLNLTRFDSQPTVELSETQPKLMQTIQNSSLLANESVRNANENTEATESEY